MPDTSKDKDLDHTKRIMERLVNTPPKPHDSGKAKGQPKPKGEKPANEAS